MAKIKYSEILEKATELYEGAIRRLGEDYRVTLESLEIKNPKSLEIQRIINASSFGCQKENVLKLFSVLLGDDLVSMDLGIIPFKGSTFRKAANNEGSFKEKPCLLYKGLFLVPVKNPNKHNYILGDTVMVVKDGGDICTCIDGTDGNHIGTDTRIATPEEIAKFLCKRLDIYYTIFCDVDIEA